MTYGMPEMVYVFIMIKRLIFKRELYSLFSVPTHGFRPHLEIDYFFKRKFIIPTYAIRDQCDNVHIYIYIQYKLTINLYKLLNIII